MYSFQPTTINLYILAGASGRWNQPSILAAFLTWWQPRDWVKPHDFHKQKETQTATFLCDATATQCQGPDDITKVTVWWQYCKAMTLPMHCSLALHGIREWGLTCWCVPYHFRQYDKGSSTPSWLANEGAKIHCWAMSEVFSVKFLNELIGPIDWWNIPNRWWVGNNILAMSQISITESWTKNNGNS